MPDLQEMKVLIIGSGPTTIGQTGECAQGALEACRALTGKGCRMITVDANPDAVFNEKPWSHRPKIEPLTPETISEIIETEKPDAVLTIFGGRDGLHLASKLYQNNILPGRSITVWGPSNECLNSIRDRDTLQSTLSPIGLKTPSIFPVNGVDAAVATAQRLGFPVVLRCDDAQLLPDGLLIYNQDELNHIVTTLAAESDVKFSVEASLLEWQQVELEVLRDQAGSSKIIGAIEYLDTAGVHPGDAIGVCPPQTLPESFYVTLKEKAEAIASHLNIVGSATVRFAYHPIRLDLLVLAVHPRYTRSSAMVARTKGVPIAKISSLLTAGFTLDSFSCELAQTKVHKGLPEAVGVKWPRWDFARLENTEDHLGLQMQATGHRVGFGASFKEALQKAARTDGSSNNGILSKAIEFDHEPVDVLLPRLATPSSRRPFELFAALCKGAAIDEIAQRTHIATGFIEQFKELTETVHRVRSNPNGALNETLLRQAIAEGFSHSDLARLLNVSVQQIEAQLAQYGVIKNWRSLPNQEQNLRYSIYNSKTAMVDDKGLKKVLLIGNGAYGIGNGTECDYGIFYAAHTLEKLGYAPVIINSNISSTFSSPGSMMTCYCDPLTDRQILDVVQLENPVGIMAQFAGTMAVYLVAKLKSMDCNLLGTPLEAIQLQHDRVNFRERMRQLGILQPLSRSARTTQEAHQLSDQVGYPLLVSAFHGSSAQIIRDAPALDRYLSEIDFTDEHPLWIEQLLEYAIEAQAEVLCDGQKAHTVAVMEHIELAGVHAGDSATVLPPYSIAPRHMDTITEYCHSISTALGIKGLINLRFGIYRDTVYLLETGSNISRNLAVVSKALNVPLVAWATRLMMGDCLDDLDISSENATQCSVRAPVFPFNVFSKIDPLLGPNMRATGQVMAHADTFGMAYFKAMSATATPLPTQGTVLITVTDEDKSSILEPARIFYKLGFNIMATKGTHKVLAEHGIETTRVRKLGFGRPNLVDEIKNGNVQMVINTPTGGQGQIDDSVIRKAAIGCRIVNITTPASALAAAKGIAAAIRQTD